MLPMTVTELSIHMTVAHDGLCVHSFRRLPRGQWQCHSPQGTWETIGDPQGRAVLEDLYENWLATDAQRQRDEEGALP